MLRPLMPPPTTTQSTEYGSPASAFDGGTVDCLATEHRKVGRRRDFLGEDRMEEEAERSRPLILAGKQGREGKGRRSVRVAIAERKKITSQVMNSVET